MAGMFLIMALVGVAIGTLSGLIGVGGGMIMVPLFRLILNMTPVGATATSLFTIIPTSLSGVVSHLRQRTCVPALGLALGIGGALTSPVGVMLAQHSPGWAVIGAAAIVIAYSSFTMLRKGLRAPRKDAPTEGVTAEGVPTEDAPDADENAAATFAPTFRNMAIGFGIGMITGIASGYVGLGGGFIMVPLMASMLRFPMRYASGTSLLAIMILAIPGAITQSTLGNVDFLVGIAVACGSIPGAFLGALLSKRMPERALRLTFAGFLGVAAILMVGKELLAV